MRMLALTHQRHAPPGFPEGVSGAEFAERVVAQARRFGVELLGAQEVRRVGVAGETGSRFSTTTPAAPLPPPAVPPGPRSAPRPPRGPSGGEIFSRRRPLPG